MALGTIFGYFTITTNLLVAVVFTCVAIRRESVGSWVIAGTVLSTLMVGVVVCAVAARDGRVVGRI